MLLLLEQRKGLQALIWANLRLSQQKSLVRKVNLETNVKTLEVVLKIASKHKNKQAIEIFLKEISGLSLATPPGLSSFTGAGRAKPSPIIRLFSYLTPKSDVEVKIDLDTKQEIFK